MLRVLLFGFVPSLFGALAGAALFSFGLLCGASPLFFLLFGGAGGELFANAFLIFLPISNSSGC